MERQPVRTSMPDGPAWCVAYELLTKIIEERRASSASARTWSYESIGKELGVSGVAISNICRGRTRQPNPRLVTKLAELLGVPVETIVVGRLPVDIDWLAPEILEGLRRLQDPGRRDEVARCLRNLLWMGAERDG
jgi:transcriptional regulator with XRE-family HTH domain